MFKPKKRIIKSQETRSFLNREKTNQKITRIPFIFEPRKKRIRKSQESHSFLTEKKTNQKITRIPFIFNREKNESICQEDFCRGLPGLRFAIAGVFMLTFGRGRQDCLLTVLPCERLCCCTRPDVAQQEPETKCEHQDGRHQKFKQKLHGDGKLKWLQVLAIVVIMKLLLVQSCSAAV
jgi:hypothetical protein